MPEEVQDASVVSSPTPDASVASSATDPSQEQVSQEGTAPQTQPEPEKKWNMPPEERWEELRRERDEARRLAELAVQKFQPPQPQVVPQEDPWKGLVDHPDPATAQFYLQQRSLFQREAERLADQKIQGVLQAVDAGRRELAEIKISQFRKENPDIKPGSQEEAEVARYVGQGHDLTNAKKLAFYDRLEAENRALKSKQSSVGSKVAANATGPTSSIPAGSGLPGQPGDWRETVRQAARKGGSLADIINAAGASRAD